MIHLKPLALALVAAASMILSSAATAGIVWNEQAPGAGDVLATAQATFDTTYKTLDRISGALTNDAALNAYEVDVYRIRVDDASGFSASITDGVNDFALFLFDIDGLGVFMSDDNPFPDPSMTAAPVSTGGIYYLAVALMVSTPLDNLGNAIFDCIGCSESGPVGGAGALEGWQLGGAFAGSPFSYDIMLTGATNSDIPEPATAALLLAGGIGAWVSRRRRNPIAQAVAA